ncbi:MAG TPA: hypothetical protein VGP55_14845 [Chitinophagaceae bacterium]|nr:hypothetical protein [Chitinophagaceae bacterium]
MRKFIFILIFFFSSCKFYKLKHTNIELIIQDAGSYRYDFKKEIYTVFSIDKSPIEIKFELSNEEKKGINEKYYELHLNKLPAKVSIEGDCMISPAFFTTLYIKRDSSMQEIQIESGCRDYNLFNRGKAERINNFLKYIYKIVKVKPEIKNSPKSNIHYM